LIRSFGLLVQRMVVIEQLAHINTKLLQDLSFALKLNSLR
jgi:hypothetical protein